MDERRSARKSGPVHILGHLQAKDGTSIKGVKITLVQAMTRLAILLNKKAPIGGAWQNAAPLDFKISADIQCVITGDLASNRNLIDSVGSTPFAHFCAVCN